MLRRTHLIVSMATVAAILAGCDGTQPVNQPGANQKPGEAGASKLTFEINKTDEEWKKQLTPEQYRIARQKGTERAFTGAYWDEKTKGIYKCVCCDNPLYSSETKFKSGTGWPSFWDAVKEGAVVTESDTAFGMVRTELMCGKCGAHLGHVFNDGPQPTGMRHCINSASLKLEAKE